MGKGESALGVGAWPPLPSPWGPELCGYGSLQLELGFHTSLAPLGYSLGNACVHAHLQPDCQFLGAAVGHPTPAAHTALGISAHGGRSGGWGRSGHQHPSSWTRGAGLTDLHIPGN